MKGIQFWTLMIVSIAVSLLMVKQIFISRAIIKQNHALVDAHERVDSEPVYKAAWEKLAVAVWKASQHDPMLGQLLKDESVSVHVGSPPPSTNAAPSPAGLAPQAPASHPATP